MNHTEAWLWPSAVLTALGGACALLLLPNPAALFSALHVLPAWMAVAALIASLYAFFRAMFYREREPIDRFRGYINRDYARVLKVGGVVLMAGLNMIAFMWIKTLLNQNVEFWAGPYFARIDYVLLFGHDPWRLLQPFAFPGAGLIYLPAWFALMISALLITAAAPPSRERSAALLSYFALWTLVGPLIHLLMPAAGPIFFERRGHGMRYHGIEPLPEVKAVADYLWTIYSNRQFGLASGISAMPSMHVTMATWTLLVFRRFAPHLRWVAIAGWLAIAVLSMALGWHFACDGIVGTAAAIVTWKALRFAMRERGAAAVPAPANAPLSA